MPELLIQRDAVMSSFCYAYTEALLNRLLQLIKTNGVFKEEKPSDESAELTDLAFAIIQNLHTQVPTPASGSNHIKPKKLEKYIGTVKAFLAAFQK